MKKNRRISIIGSGGFACEVLSILESTNYECLGFIDSNKNLTNLPLPIIGHEDEMNLLIEKYNFSNCIIAIGNPIVRKKVSNKIQEYSLKYPVISDLSAVSKSNDIKSGTIIYPNVVIMNNCKIGKFTLINSGVTLGHDVTVGDFCNINPGANLAGKIKVGNGSFIGIGASIKENINIGKNVVIGAGSVVIEDVPDNTIVYGVPAKPQD